MGEGVAIHASRISAATDFHHYPLSFPEATVPGGCVADCVELLVSMGAVLVQPALLEDKLGAARKKSKNIVFADPFILHAVRFWLSPSPDSPD